MFFRNQQVQMEIDVAEAKEREARLIQIEVMYMGHPQILENFKILISRGRVLDLGLILLSKSILQTRLPRPLTPKKFWTPSGRCKSI